MPEKDKRGKGWRVQTCLYLDIGQREELRTLARRRKVPMAVLVREALERYLGAAAEAKP